MNNAKHEMKKKKNSRCGCVSAFGKMEKRLFFFCELKQNFLFFSFHEILFLFAYNIELKRKQKKRKIGKYKGLLYYLSCSIVFQKIYPIFLLIKVESL
jgi:hypothetical protein